MEEVDATTARRVLRPVLDRAAQGKPTAITRHGEVIAVVVPAGWVFSVEEQEQRAAVLAAAQHGAVLSRDA
jgi:prevent-host-death family protein